MVPVVAAGQAAPIRMAAATSEGSDMSFNTAVISTGIRSSLIKAIKYILALRSIFFKSDWATEKPATIMARGVFISAT